MVTFLTFLSSLRMLMLVLNLELAGSFPKPLSAARERECLKRMSEGDQSARDELIEHNLRLVVHIIKKYYPNVNDQDDLISIGTIGLIKAVSTFNCEKGARFATYASRCIENEILMNFRSKKKTAQDVYLFEPIDTDKDGNALTLLDIMADETSMVEEIENKMRAAKLRRLVNELPDQREKEIIILRYGLSGGEPMTQRTVAQKLKISRSYVSRIEKKAIERLREELSEGEEGDSRQAF